MACQYVDGYGLQGDGYGLQVGDRVCPIERCRAWGPRGRVRARLASR